MDDDIIKSVWYSMSFSDCISQTFASPKKLFPSPNEEKENDGCLPELENCKDMELISGDIHYHIIVSTLLKSPSQLIVGPCMQTVWEVQALLPTYGALNDQSASPYGSVVLCINEHYWLQIHYVLMSERLELWMHKKKM